MAILAYWNSLGSRPSSEWNVDEFTSGSLFAESCSVTYTSQSPFKLEDDINVKLSFDKDSMDTCPGIWAHVRMQSTYADSSDPNVTVSFAQSATLCFDRDGKCGQLTILNDPRDYDRLMETMEVIKA